MGSTITIRNVPDKAKRALKRRAALNGRSMEAEARAMIGDLAKNDAPPKRALSPLPKSKLSPQAEAALARLQKMFAPKSGEKPYTSDDFLRDRRADWGEE
jgi:plasmid stability protein